MTQSINLIIATYDKPISEPVQYNVRRRPKYIYESSVLRCDERVRPAREISRVDKGHLVEACFGRDAERAEHEVPSDVRDEAP